MAYGLGNLAFDSPVPLATRGVILETVLDARGVASFRHHPVVVRQRRTVLAARDAPPIWSLRPGGPGP